MSREDLGRLLCRRYEVDTLREAIGFLMEEVDFLTALADELEPLPPEGSAYVDEEEREQEREVHCLAAGLSRWG
ncbi:hypothetical protein [uncultured Bacteroides sp.]|uniref:hypothetical protein n=1 Tax=uncultured Bacteroides sp. TaxID=162156 RepID=UPI002AA7CEF8|nr:hypothetical protein [uncultured Bacteroides sp.]